MKDCLMSLKIRKNKFSIFITLLLILALLTGLTAGYFSTHGITAVSYTHLTLPTKLEV